MNRINWTAWTLSLCLLTGCAGSPPPASSSPAPTPALGRYIEKTVPLPEGLTSVEDFAVLGDQSLALLVAGDGPGQTSLYVSNDGGNTWNTRETPQLDVLKSDAVSVGALEPDGGILLMHQRQEGGAGEYAAEAAPQEPYMILRAGPDGQTADRALPDDYFDRGIGYPVGMAVSPEGYILLHSYSAMALLDPADLSVVWTASVDGDTGGQPAISGVHFLQDRIAVASRNKVLFYDLPTGERLEARDVQGGFYGLGENASFSTSAMMWRAMTGAPGQPDAFYYCTLSGIYRQFADGSLTERLADGSLLSLSLPSMQVCGLAAEAEGSFLILYRNSANNAYELKRYVFDKTAPAVPDTELTVYALEESPSVRQAIGAFQQLSPHVRVRFTAAGEEERGLSRADITRALNTELLAGKGPDVLVLDGLPAASYEEKGVLRDLKGLSAQKAASGEWLAQTEAFRRDDGAVFYIPARFEAPVMIASREAAGRIGSLSGLVRYLNAERDAQPALYPSWYSQSRPDLVMADWFALCSPDWLTPDGSFDEASFTAFLRDIKTLCDLSSGGDEDFRPSLTSQAISWYEGRIPQAIAPLASVSDLAAALHLIGEKGEGVLIPLPGPEGGAYIPRVLLGVNANNARQDLAVSFVETVLSGEVQKLDLGDGLPVNADSFNGLLSEPGGAGRYEPSYGYTDAATGENIIYTIRWPAQPALADAINMIRALRIPAPQDRETLELILDETAGYFDGSQPLTEAVSSAGNKIRLRMSENQ